MSRKRVFMISPFARPNLGGVESHLDKLTAALVRRDLEVTIVAYQPLVTDAVGSWIERFDGGVILRVPRPGRNIWPRIENNFGLTFLYLVPGLLIGALWYWFRSRDRFDVIHCHGFSAAFIGWFLRLIGVRTRMVLSTHAVYRLTGRKLLAFLIKHLVRPMNHILAVGHAARIELEKVGVPEGRLGVHHNWVDVDIYCPRDKEKARSDLGWHEKGMHALFVGRLLKIKGVEILIQLAARHSDIQIHVFGAAGEMDDEVSLAADHLANFSVVSEPGGSGSARQKSVSTIYNAADLLLVPSIYEEGAATVVLEASSCGTPVLSSNMGCLPELVQNDVNGWTVPPDIESFSRKLAQISNDDSILTQTSVSARGFAEQRFSEGVVEEIISAYGF